MAELPNHLPPALRRPPRLSGSFSALCAALAFAAAGSAVAQDRRTVTEPVFPQSCAVLSAQLGIASGEPTSETAFDTARIQAALAACPVGQAVELVASGTNTAFLIQPIDLPGGVALVIDGGATVFASRNPADYQLAGSVETCGTVGTKGNGCRSLFTVNHGSTSSGAAIMGYGVVDGRGQDPLLVAGVPSTQSWWDLAAAANVAGGDQNNFVLLTATKANAFTLYKITLRNSAMFHVQWRGTGFTAWGVKVIAPYTARNSDGIDPGGSDITVTRSSISVGDDEVAISASSASSYITLSNLQGYSGHGISVGSYTQGGLTNLLVDHVNLAGTAGDANANGLRLKSSADRGGLIENVTYQNLCVKDVRRLIAFDPFYNANPGTLLPQFTNVVIRNAHFLTGGTVQIEGFDAAHPTTLTLDNVVFDTLGAADLSPAPQYTAIALGPGAVYPAFLQTLKGTGVSSSGSAPPVATGARDCAGAFPSLVGELYLSTTDQTNLTTLKVSGAGSFTLNAMVQPAMSQVSWGAWTGIAPLQQPIEFLEGGAVVGSAALGANGTLSSLTLSNVGGGTHTYAARYPGDAAHAALTFGAATVVVDAPTKAPSATQATAPLSATFGGALALSATVTGAGPTPTGSVAFRAGATLLGSAALQSGAAALAVSPLSLAVGTYPVVASYSGDATYAPSDSSGAAGTLSVAPGPTVAALALPASPVAAGTEISLTASVAGTGGTPAGAVTFLQGATIIDTVPLAAGQATLKVRPSAAGALALTVRYPGGGNFAASSSPPQTLEVIAPFVLSAAPLTLTLAPGASAALALSLTPQGGFTGPVTLSCNSPVAWLTCTLAPGALAISGPGAVAGSATISVAAATAGARPARTGMLPAALAPLSLLLLLCWRPLRRLPLLPLLLLLASGALSACGGSGAGRPPPGAQVVTLTASSNGVTASAQATVVITN